MSWWTHPGTCWSWRTGVTRTSPMSARRTRRSNFRPKRKSRTNFTAERPWRRQDSLQFRLKRNKFVDVNKDWVIYQQDEIVNFLFKVNFKIRLTQDMQKCLLLCLNLYPINQNFKMVFSNFFNFATKYLIFCNNYIQCQCFVIVLIMNPVVGNVIPNNKWGYA